jgi:ABC-2 type transport system permease protein
MNEYAWLIRREFWERRSVWLVPAIIATLLILITTFGQVHVFAVDLPLEMRQQGIAYLAITNLLFYLVLSLCVALYFLDCLYDDRRDRSILFWKSLPISDTTTVLSKLVMGLVAFPLVYWVITQLACLVVATVVSLRVAETRALIWDGDLWLKLQELWMYLILTSAFWYLPVVGWFLLVSAAVRRAPMLWSVLPFVVLGLIEHYFIGTNGVSHLVGRRLLGYFDTAFRAKSFVAEHSLNIGTLLNFEAFFKSPETWIGLIVGALLIVATIQLRMRRSEV